MNTLNSIKQRGAYKTINYYIEIRPINTIKEGSGISSDGCLIRIKSRAKKGQKQMADITFKFTYLLSCIMEVYMSLRSMK